MNRIAQFVDFETDPLAPVEEALERWRFDGKELLVVEEDLIYNRACSCDPRVGKWLDE